MENKNIVLLQNTEIGWHLALSTFLTWLIREYKSGDWFNFSLICWYIDKLDQLEWAEKQIDIYEIWTSYNKISDNLLFMRKSFKKLISLNRKVKIDILHCLYPNSSLMSAVLFKLFVNRKVKIIYDIRSPWIEMSFANSHISKKKNRVRNLMHFSEKILTKFVDYFVFISEWTKEYYTNKYNLSLKDNLSIIPTWVDVEKFSKPIPEQQKDELRKKHWIGLDDTVIGYVGTISKMREMSNFLATQIDWIKSNPTVKFLMIWEWDDLENIKQVVKDGWVDKQFIFAGKMKQSELIPYIHIFNYWRCHLPDIFVFRNSFPLKILEYMAAWVHVLASDIKAHRDIARENDWRIEIYLTDFPNKTNLNATVLPINVQKYSRVTLLELYVYAYKQKL